MEFFDREKNLLFFQFDFSKMKNDEYKKLHFNAQKTKERNKSVRINTGLIEEQLSALSAFTQDDKQ